MLKIYGRANSINVRKVLWTADEIGLQYTREDWGRGFRPTTEPEFLKVNPFALVPVIDDDGFVLRESHAIVRYLAAKHVRTDLYPAGLARRAEVEAWMDWGQTELHQGARAPFLGLVVKMPAFQDPKMIEFGIAEWTRQMEMLDSYLAGHGPYLMGEDFTLADVPAGLSVNRWFSVPFDKPELKAVSAYYDRLAERPAYRRHGRNGTP
ncbi:MAG: glutathione S-transferase family protein [Hyphomicrobiaceae bacterium]|nr:glutathione S-transferase family protein [Hyphomicrobiaceae bacterium]